MTITQGDVVTVSLTCSGHNLTGATMTTILPKGDGTDLTIANAQHTKDADQVANPGLFTIDLTEAQTKLLKEGDGQNIITKIVQGSDTIHFHGSAVLNVKKSTFRSA
jgi:hypothetical protein